MISEIHRQPARLRDALRAINEERATDDPLNALVLKEGLDWREVEVLRTLRNHLLQIRPNYNVETVTSVLVRNSPVAGALWQLFGARFDPHREGDRAEAVARAEALVEKAFAAVGSLFDDEILRGVENLLRAAVRTNYYQRPERPVLAIKVDCAKVEGMVSPRPLFEIYVHSRLLEGIHLRGGKVARGGIRWSDRHDDFRTEVLGLMKTQMVKNSVIVPVGSKGGFVLKGDVPPRPALDAYLIDRYREFVSGLLDVTDNLVDGNVIHPPEVVRHDEPDPYLVVAADKGTAHLSDTANRVSAQYGFWLGDAFASGGSNGYDHKKEGITARGAWECVRHHFLNLGVDVQSEPFTMAGIGDMSGDVFGNGVLLSRQTRLVAAFNHVHIFLDPSPDPEASFAERERLFRLPRSTWRDYRPDLISAGGGIFDRGAKAIPLSPEVRRLLDVSQETASGEEVVRAILRAPVDLLYNGGIGTYVRATGEEDAEVGDRANDRVRVNASEVRARVVAEGGNLGLTQRGRIELWTKGVLLNTDAVDNSGGVDMSDHEVNIKILLDLLVRRGIIPGRADRNRILAEMTDEVSALVLADNASQALALTLDGLRSASRHEDFVGLVEDLVAGGVLSRSDDAVPSKDELLASSARDRGLPRPLLCVMLGHVKNRALRAPPRLLPARQRGRRAVPAGLLPDADARGVRRAPRPPPAAPGDHRDGRRQPRRERRGRLAAPPVDGGERSRHRRRGARVPRRRAGRAGGRAPAPDRGGRPERRGAPPATGGGLRRPLRSDAAVPAWRGRRLREGPGRRQGGPRPGPLSPRLPLFSRKVGPDSRREAGPTPAARPTDSAASGNIRRPKGHGDVPKWLREGSAKASFVGSNPTVASSEIPPPRLRARRFVHVAGARAAASARSDGTSTSWRTSAPKPGISRTWTSGSRRRSERRRSGSQERRRGTRSAGMTRGWPRRPAPRRHGDAERGRGGKAREEPPEDGGRESREGRRERGRPARTPTKAPTAPPGPRRASRLRAWG